MHILIQLGDPYCNENPAAKRIKTFCQVWAKLGYQVTILAPQCDESMRTYGNVLICPTCKLKKTSKISRAMNGIVYSVTSFIRSLSMEHVDVVLTTSPPPLISISGWLIAKVKRARLIYDVRDVWPDVAVEAGGFSSTSIYARIFGFIRDFMLKHADLVTTVTPGKVSKLQQYKPRGKVIEITNGLDEDFLSYEEDIQIVKRWNIGDPFTCVFTGNFGFGVGLSQLLDLAKRVQQEGLRAQFLLFGKGIDEQPLRIKVQDEHIENVRFAGQVTNREIYSVLKYAQVSFISTTNGNLRDSIPTKIFEALGIGCPVLLVAEGDSVDLLYESGLGVATHPNDEEGLWEAFQWLYYNREKILSHRDEARKLMLTKYSRQKAALKLGEMLQELC